jgi:uncharacterized protein YbjT (DUF2867 family)
VESRKTVVLAGGTGLTGSFLLQQLIRDDSVQTVHAFTRHADNPDLPKVAWHPYDDLSGTAIPCDSVFITLGTTIRQAGSKDVFEQVDRHLVRQVAAWGLRGGARQLLVVSSLGADTGSLFFYSRVKGLMEQEVSRLGYDQVHIFRPAILDGPREEKRAGEGIALQLFRRLRPVLIGPLKTYRAIKAEIVAAAMRHAAQSGKPGVHIYPSDVIQDMGNDRL